MQIGTARHLQALVRSRRSELGISQQELADRVSVSRKWVSDFEGGRTGSELPLVLRVLAALELELTVRPTNSRPGTPPAADSVDLDALLTEHGDLP